MASRGRSNFNSGRVRKFQRNPDADEDEFGGKKESLFANEDLGTGTTLLDDDATGEATLKRFEEIEKTNAIDTQMGFTHYTSGPAKLGWMVNMRSVTHSTMHLS